MLRLCSEAVTTDKRAVAIRDLRTGSGSGRLAPEISSRIYGLACECFTTTEDGYNVAANAALSGVIRGMVVVQDKLAATKVDDAKTTSLQ